MIIKSTTVAYQVTSTTAFRLVYPFIFHIPFSLSIDFLFLGTLPQIRIPVTPHLDAVPLQDSLPDFLPLSVCKTVDGSVTLLFTTLSEF